MRPARNKPARQPVRLLVIDPHEPVRELLAELLPGHGYEVEAVATDAEALQLAQLVRWDGVIMDLDSPALNGLELYSRILRHGDRLRLPVIFMTSRPDSPLRWSLVQAPWARLLQKPCGFGELLGALERGLQSAVETAESVARK